MKRGLAALLLALVLGACVTAPIYNPTHVPLSGHEQLTVELVRERIVRAARMQTWTPEDLGPGVMIVTRREGLHTGIATIHYDLDKFSITLRSSVNFKQKDGMIHKRYNDWIAALETTIRREVAAPQ
jgi:hypothetical protein